MVQKTIIFFGSIFSIIVVFYFCRFLLVYSWLDNATIDYTIVPVDVISIILSSALTIWVGWYIAKKLTEQRFEKDFLIKDLTQIENEVHEIESVFNVSGNIDLSYIASKNNNVQLMQERLSKTLELMKISDLSIEKLYQKTGEMYQATTNFESPIVAVSDIDIQFINVKCNSVIIEARNLIILINNM
jgi:hypothetical protein